MPPSYNPNSGTAANHLFNSTEKHSFSANRAAQPQANIGFTYFRPPINVEVLVRDGRLVYIRSRLFAGHVTNSSGVWKGNSHWWDKNWRALEWDIEVETQGVYRLCYVRGPEGILIGLAQPLAQ